MKLVTEASKDVHLVPWQILEGAGLDVFNFVLSMHFFFLYHIYREGNICDDKLANYGFEEKHEFYLFDIMPEFIRGSFLGTSMGYLSVGFLDFVIMSFGLVP